MSQERPLTSGEIELAKSVFGDAVNVTRVRLIRRKWWPFQPRGVVMAPMGNIHFHPYDNAWSDDFARESLSAQGLFVHEMTHIWQSQAKGRFYLPLMRHPFCRYAYSLVPGRPFEHYGLEQQAEIVRHVFFGERGVVLAQRPARDLLPFPRDGQDAISRRSA